MRKKCLCLLALSLLIARSLRADDALGENLGSVHFAASGHGDAPGHVVRGVKLLHHMMYLEADDEFAAALASDPNCALAWWGRAMTIIHPLWPDIPTADDRALGAGYLKQGIAIASATPRERAYLETLNVYFNSADDDYPHGLQALDRAWMALSDQYPDDLDALAFAALYHLSPIRYQPRDPSSRRQVEAVTWLQQILARIPDHPGGQHYKIHALDSPALADSALEICNSYGALAPDVPHALHMPSHIYIRRGLWEKSIAMNLRSAAAADQLRQKTGEVSNHLPHALDYLAYAYLQRGQYREADAIIARLESLPPPYSAAQRGAIGFAFAAAPAREALERRRWDVAAALPLHQPAAFPWGPAFLHCDSIIHFARAVGAARSGRLETARSEIAALDEIHRTLAAGKTPRYWVAQAEAQSLAAQGWVHFSAKENAAAVECLRRAVAIEASADKEAVTPGEVLPAGEQLGELLLELGQPAEALAAYEAVLTASPNRFNALYGAGLAAERANQGMVALGYYRTLLQVAATADPGNVRLEHARAVVEREAVVARLSP